MQFTRGYATAPFCCPTRRSLVIGQTPARYIDQQDRSTWEQRYREQLSIPRMLSIGEQNSLATSMPQKANELHGQLIAFLNQVGAETEQTIKKGDAQSNQDKAGLLKV